MEPAVCRVKLGGNSHSFIGSVCQVKSASGEDDRGAALVALSLLFQSKQGGKKKKKMYELHWVKLPSHI